jgi:trimeric autotransporter adhesin
MTMEWKPRGWTLIGMLMLACSGIVGGVKVDAAMVQAAGSSTIATTQVTDTVYLADGTAASGTVLISWGAFTTASGESVPSGSTSVVLGAGGSLSVSLVPNAGSTPMGTYYTAVYHLSDGSVSREFWVVPVSQSPVEVSAIESTVLPASVAMQTVSKSYVDTAIAAAVTGHPLDSSSPFVQKTGDAMTGPLVLPGDPTTTNQAADKHYVDVSVAALAGGEGQMVSLFPAGTQTVVQQVGTQLQVNHMNGEEYASQYVSGNGGNGIANAVSSADCTGGCDVKVERSYSSTENYNAATWNSGAGGTHVEDDRYGQRYDSYLNPGSVIGSGQDAGQVVDVTSTRSTQAEFASGETGSTPSAFALVVKQQALTGGNNLFPASIESVPYFKTNYNAISVAGTYNTPGQHLLDSQGSHCYGVGDCLIGSQFLTSSGGVRDEADEGTHPFDIQVQEDTAVFQGTCSSGCSPGSTVVKVAVSSGPGTQGEGRYLIDKNPAKVITTGTLISGTGGVGSGPGPSATFSGTNFPVSVFVTTAETIPSQTNNVAPGLVTVPIATSGVTAGFATNTSAVPGSSGVACITDTPNGDNPHNYEMASYTVVDGTHLQMALNKAHRLGATIAFGGLCGYGLEQTVDTANGIRQVFPVVGSYSSTGLYYAGGLTSIVGLQNNTSAFVNVSMQVAAIARSNNVVTVTTAGTLAADVNGLTMTVSGVADGSYNGSFVVTTTGSNTLTYNQSGANSTSTGGAVGMVTGGYALYPMAEVLGVFDTATKSVDGQLTLAPNTVGWAASDPVEEPHYYQQVVGGDVTFISQTTPRPTLSQTAGVQYQLNAGPGLTGWTVNNAVPATSYMGSGGTHTEPHAAYAATGVWQTSMDLVAGEQSVFAVHCNAHGCGRWDSGYDLFDLDSSVGGDRVSYQPVTSTFTMVMTGQPYSFSPQAFTAATVDATTINATTINATTLNGPVSAASLPLFKASGTGHAQGAVPDPGATSGATRYLREDGTWAAAGGATQISTNLLARYALTDGSGAPQDSSGNGNNATLPGGSANPTWTAQGISCDGASQYFNSVGTRGARTFVWSSTEMVPLNAASPIGTQFVTPFGVADLSVVIGGNGYYGSHPGVGSSGSYSSLSNGTLQGTHTFALTLGTNSATDPDHLYMDGVETTYSTGQGASSGVATTAFQVCGANTGFGTFFPGQMYYFEAFSDEKTPQQIALETNAVTQIVQGRGVLLKTPPSSTIKDLYVAVGDSLTNGEGVNPSSQYIAPSDTFDVVNYGLGNSATDDLFELFEAREGTLYRHNAGRNVLRLWAGTNDVSTHGRTTQQALDGIRAYCRKAKAAGFQTIVSDMISRTGNDNNMLALDAMLTTEDTGCDLVLDLASNPVLGAVGANTNATYYQGDDTHLTQAGQQNVVAAAETRAINLLDHLKSSNTSATVTTATYAMADYDLYLPVNPASNAVAATLPDCNYFTGMTRSVKNLQTTGTNAVTVAPAAGQTIDGSGAAVTVANGATLVLRQIVVNRTTAGCSWVKVSNN